MAATNAVYSQFRVCMQSPIHSKNNNFKDNYKDDNISVHASGWYCL